MPDIDITKLLTSSGGKLWDDFTVFMRDRAKVAEGVRKVEAQQALEDTEALQRVIPAIDSAKVSYRAERAERAGDT